MVQATRIEREPVKPGRRKERRVRTIAITPAAFDLIEKAVKANGLSYVEFMSRVLKWASMLPPDQLSLILWWATDWRQRGIAAEPPALPVVKPAE